MKGFLAGAFVTAPITAFVMFLYFQNLDRMGVQQERAVTEQRLQELQFDQDFNKMAGFVVAPADKKKAAKKRAALEKKLSKLDKLSADGLIQSQSDAKAAREALNAAPPPAPTNSAALLPPLPPLPQALPDPGDPGGL